MLVVSGVEENMDRDVWMSLVQRALQIAAGRDVNIADAFRVGNYSEQINRLVLVKLKSAWSRRLVVNGAKKLAGDLQFRRKVFINPDEPLEVRRRTILNRLKAGGT